MEIQSSKIPASRRRGPADLGGKDDKQRSRDHPVTGAVVVVASTIMAVGGHGKCKTHRLPLDARGGCELCRLDEMPSKPPPSRVRRWLWATALVVIVLSVVALGFLGA